MIYFADLTPYSYNGAVEDDRIVNVGWLSIDHEFPRGTVPQSFVDQLAKLIKSPSSLYRGFHHCEFCQPHEHYSGDQHRLRTVDPEPERIGNGEIRGEGRDGITYVAPVLVWHYVDEHGYLPPQAFIDAVLTGR